MTERPSGTPDRPWNAGRASNIRGLALALSATVFWSLAGILIRLITDATSWHVILYRSLGATAMVGAMIAIVHRGAVSRAIRLAGWPAVVAGICSSASSVLFILALGRVTVANATFMGGITPFVTAIGAQAILGAHPMPIWVVATDGLGSMRRLVDFLFHAHRIHSPSSPRSGPRPSWASGCPAARGARWPWRLWASP